MYKRFFEPYVGEYYTKGINDKKVLVLGASCYCDKVWCPYFAECTSVVQKDSSKFDKLCPVYLSDGKELHLEPSYCIEDACSVAYSRFAEYIGKHLNTDSYAEIWSRMAFTNYVQFFLPATNGQYRETYTSDMSERDFEAFLDVLRLLQPDIVVIWGAVINSRLKQQNPYLLDRQELRDTEHYVCHIQVPGVNQIVALINPNHPSHSPWYSGLEKFDKYFTTLITPQNNNKQN